MLTLVSMGRWDDYGPVVIANLTDGQIQKYKDESGRIRLAEDKTFKHLCKMEQIARLEPHREPELEAAKVAYKDCFKQRKKILIEIRALEGSSTNWATVDLG